MIGGLAELHALAGARQRLVELADTGERGGEPDARAHGDEPRHAPALADPRRRRRRR